MPFSLHSSVVFQLQICPQVAPNNKFSKTSCLFKISASDILPCACLISIPLKYHIIFAGRRFGKHEAIVLIAAMMHAAHISFVVHPIHLFNVVIHTIPTLNGDGNKVPSNLIYAAQPPSMFSIVSFVCSDGFTYDTILNRYVSPYTFSIKRQN